MKWPDVKNVTFCLVLLVLTVVIYRQTQISDDIEEMQKSELKFKQDMVQYMNMTTDSINSHTEAIKSNSHSIEMLAQRRP